MLSDKISCLYFEDKNSCKKKYFVSDRELKNGYLDGGLLQRVRSRDGEVGLRTERAHHRNQLARLEQPQPGVDVMITIFCDFSTIFGEINWRFS
jgi:hypothetical protein